MSVQLHEWLQSVLNAAARLKIDHICPLFRDLHWLNAPEHVKFMLCVLVYRHLHGMEPPYLADDLYPTSADSNLRHYWSADSPTWIVSVELNSTRAYQALGDRAFPEAAARAWNSRQGCAITSVILELPEDMDFWTDSDVTLTLPGYTLFRFVFTHITS